MISRRSSASRVATRRSVYATDACPREFFRFWDGNRRKVTVAEAAEYLGLSRTTVQEMVERGQLETEGFAGAIRIPREEVERETAP